MKELVVGNPAEVKSKIWALNLEPIMFKVMDKKEGKGWSLETALSAVEEYRRFLYLTVTQPTTIVPTEFVDAIWHAHILDTMKYAEDCENTFGFFLHHFPYFGMRGEEDQKTLQETFVAAAKVYEEEFNSPYFVGINGASCGTCGANACGSCAGSGIFPEAAAQNCHPSSITFVDVVRSHERPSLTI